MACTGQLIGGRYPTINTFQLKGWTSKKSGLQGNLDFYLTGRYRLGELQEEAADTSCSLLDLGN